MHDYCITVTALLEFFGWTQDRVHDFNHAINPKWLGVEFWCYKFLL